jgi:hypothetical protein
VEFVLLVTSTRQDINIKNSTLSVFVGIPEEKRPLGITRSLWRIILKCV